MNARRIAMTAASIVLLGLSGCTSATPTSPTAPTDAAGVIRQLGAVPIPTPPATPPTPSASPKHPQLLAIGAPVRVSLPDGVAALVTALGPDLNSPNGATQQCTGTITLTATVDSGTLVLHATDFTSRDETGAAVRLAANGPTTVIGRAGRPATLKLTGTFKAGAAQVTWRNNGVVIAIWDFNVELD